ncbi:MAG: murein transglycosylase A [Chitinophagales bacterium]|nr:murein transglycosylase A [Chitinophagales bacterium]
MFKQWEYILFLIVAALIIGLACHHNDLEIEVESIEASPLDARQYKLRKNGKRVGAPLLMDVYTYYGLDSIDVPVIDAPFVEALENNRKLLEFSKRKKHYQIGDLRINPSDLLATIDILQSYQYTKPLELSKYLDAYQIWGNDQKGHVRYTGYYTPVIAVDRTQSEEFRYPIYDRPLDWAGALPTRAAIESNNLFEGLDLELAYAKSKVDIYYMQLQGSGFVEYPNGEKELFAYNGNNRHPYRSIEKYIMRRDDIELTNLSINSIKRFLNSNSNLVDTILFQNPSYTFFAKKRSAPKGAGNVPLHSDFSIAVDKRYIPLGACLIASFPVYDKVHHKVIGHEYRFMVAQDVGGAIRGAGHVDVYHGVGDVAGKKAGQLNSYGQLWILLPKAPTPQYISLESFE